MKPRTPDESLPELPPPDPRTMGAAAEWFQQFKTPQGLGALSLLGLFVFGCVAFLYFAKPFLMPVTLAILLNFMLRPVVRGMARFRIPHPLGAAVALLFVIGVVATGASVVSQPAREWLAKGPEGVREVEREVRRLLRPFTRAAAQVEQITKPEPAEHAPPAPRVEIQAGHAADTILSFTGSFLAGLIEMLVLLYFLLASGNFFAQKLTRVIRSGHSRDEALAIAHELQHNISSFLFTITIINSCLGVLVGLTMSIVGLPNPLLWGVLAAVLNFIPYFGPFVGAAIFTVAGLLTFEAIGLALMGPMIYLLMHGIESNFITPLVLGRRLTLNPVVIFVSIIFWTWLWGIGGALLAVPLLMIFKILCDHVRPLAPVGEFLSG